MEETAFIRKLRQTAHLGNFVELIEILKYFPQRGVGCAFAIVSGNLVVAGSLSPF